MISSRSLLLEILAATQALDADPAAKKRFCEAVRQVGIANGVSCLEREARVLFAGQLLAQRVSRATVRDRLIALYGISRCQAYRIIGGALTVSKNGQE
ncbi:hypothetical protein HUX88_29025 [Duganella sp. BJB1802]|uniref:hypothetical protein n=1 Tax=Duganella sp. BJB1802 TaxID=2744575 RepID=UPI0015935137|nr:hypothetical protein [Duganella sp. BJB1802]NVD74531.1 hypothetical protein [Duganella sp. BJB1802]